MKNDNESIIPKLLTFDWFSDGIFLVDLHMGMSYGIFAPFNNISGISWRSVLSVEEIGVSGENHRPAPSHLQTLSYNVVSSTPCWKKYNSYWMYIPIIDFCNTCGRKLFLDMPTAVYWMFQ